MSASARPPTLDDLLHISRRLEADRSLSPAVLRQRDHAIGQQCQQRKPLDALLFWLDNVDDRTAPEPPALHLREKQWALLFRLLALALGASGMAGFLLASERALVNVPLFLLVFVLLQFLLCLVAVWMTFTTLRGRPLQGLPFNPARLLSRKALPQGRILREAGSVTRLLALRYGQELGALFAAGAVAALLLLLAVTDFSFVWGSTFSISDQAVAGLTRALATPWAQVFPEAVVSPQLIADTRFHPAQADLGAMAAASRRGWWPFLFACLLFYTLLPRVLLWLVCLWGFRRQLRASLLAWPGASSVLARMRAPVVETRAEAPVHGAHPPPHFDNAVVIDWAGALENAGPEVLADLPLAGAQVAGLGSPAEDVAAVSAVNGSGAQKLLVAVRGWEPPMADLADVLREVTGIDDCTLLLVNLPGRTLSAAQLADWQRFSSSLPFSRNTAEQLDEVAA
ncbi:DUF2868 domain-containing protein [Haliea sp. E17]|uniref:DUF2868 domain-containing protein n=1 Tax=Haliea sp. E17 TaxID=3401576 RepID=UPI003AB01334